MLHQMNLTQAAFDQVKSGRKTIELRLYDEKRKRLRPGHRIAFTSLGDGRQLETLLLDYKVYKDFYELYRDYEASDLGYEKGQDKNPRDMEVFYSLKDIKKYGVIALKIRLL